MTMIRCPQTQLAHKNLLVICEPGRALTLHFMRCAEGDLRHGRPMLCDFATPSTSPVVAVAQYYSCLLCAGPPAMRIIWQAYGDKSVLEWATRRLQQVCLVRRLILLAAACLRRRHGQLSEPPFNFAAVADDRVDKARLDALHQSLKDTAACCLSPGLARQVKKDELDLRSPEAKQWVFAWALSVTLSISDTERKHAVNKAFNKGANGCSGWAGLASNAVNRAAKSMWQAQAASLDRAAASQTPASASPLVAVDPSGGATSSSSAVCPVAVSSNVERPKPLNSRPGCRIREKSLRAKTDFELFRDDHNKKRQSLGERVNPCTKEAWAHARQAWQDLPRERKQLYTEKAASDKEMMGMLRKDRKRARRGEDHSRQFTGLGQQ